MDIDNIDDAAMLFSERKRRRLGQKQWGLQVAADKIIPHLLGNFPHGSGEKAGSVVDKRIEFSEVVYGLINQIR